MENYPNVIFSEDPEIKKMQEVVEKLQLHNTIKNIVNGGNPNQNIAGTVEWETCIVSYHPSYPNELYAVTSPKDTSSRPSDDIVGSIYLKDDCLYKAFGRQQQGISGMFKPCDHRYTECFRQGKWVERLLKYSEELTQIYFKKVKEETFKKQEEKKKPFLDIDF